MIRFHVYEASYGSPTRLFICHDSDKGTGTIVSQHYTPTLVQAMRDAADELEKQANKDLYRVALEARIKAEMEAMDESASSL